MEDGFGCEGSGSSWWRRLSRQRRRKQQKVSQKQVHIFFGGRRRADGMGWLERKEMRWALRGGRGGEWAVQQLVEMKDCSVLLDAMRLLE